MPLADNAAFSVVQFSAVYLSAEIRDPYCGRSAFRGSRLRSLDSEANCARVWNLSVSIRAIRGQNFFVLRIGGLLFFTARPWVFSEGGGRPKKNYDPPYLFHHIPRPNSPQTPHAKRHNIKNEHPAVWNSFGIVGIGMRRFASSGPRGRLPNPLSVFFSVSAQSRSKACREGQ